MGAYGSIIDHKVLFKLKGVKEIGMVYKKQDLKNYLSYNFYKINKIRNINEFNNIKLDKLQNFNSYQDKSMILPLKNKTNEMLKNYKI